MSSTGALWVRAADGDVVTPVSATARATSIDKPAAGLEHHPPAVARSYSRIAATPSRISRP